MWNENGCKLLSHSTKRPENSSKVHSKKEQQKKDDVTNHAYMLGANQNARESQVSTMSCNSSRSRRRVGTSIGTTSNSVLLHSGRCAQASCTRRIQCRMSDASNSFERLQRKLLLQDISKKLSDVKVIPAEFGVVASK